LKVVILCGGQGTRMREETEYRPKPLVEVGARPILWHIMKIFAHHGLREFVLCLGYRGEMIKEYFLNYDAMNNDCTLSLGQRGGVTYHGNHLEGGLTVTLADTGQETMTGGRVRRAGRYVDGDSFVVTYGDGVSDIDLTALLAFHKSHGRLATITAVRPVSRFGVLALDEPGQVNSFAEKPLLDGWINAGFMVFHRRVLDYLDGDACVLEKEPLERLAREHQLMAYRHEGCFYAMDTYRDYKYLNDLWSRGEAPWKVWA
jgi:glucose-1-phosphate cytidylyltransferase